jgi:hypothetical protein
MTDFAPFSSAAESPGVPDSTWTSSRPSRQRPGAWMRRATTAAPTRSASSIAAAVGQLLGGMAGRRVPRIETLRQRLQQMESAWSYAELDRALHALHDATGAIDFLAGRGGAQHAQAFRQQGAAVGAAARRLGNASLGLVGKHAAEAAVARLVWIDLQLEYRSLEKRVRKGLEWMVDMDHELAARRVEAVAQVSQDALQELARRGHALEDRLHLVNGLCGAARAARALGEQVAAQRTTLCRTLQDKVRPCSLGLQHRLQPLLDAAGTRALEPAELLAAIEARHELQVALTHAGADLLQAQSLQQELATQLAWMERKAGQIG